MRASGRILLVEGDSDCLFFEHLCSSIGLKTNVRVAPPKEFGAESNNKGSLFTMVPILIKQMPDATVKNLAVVVDADYAAEHGMGCQRTIKQFTELIAPHGFSPRKHLGNPGGFLFQHNNGLNDIGLWVMPDNKADGMFEDWLKRSVCASDLPLWKYAIKTVEKAPQPLKFKEIHRTKAEVAVWMALQKIPGQGAHQALRNNLIEMSEELPKQMVSWLRQVYS